MLCFFALEKSIILNRSKKLSASNETSKQFIIN